MSGGEVFCPFCEGGPEAFGCDCCGGPCCESCSTYQETRRDGEIAVCPECVAESEAGAEFAAERAAEHRADIRAADRAYMDDMRW